MRGWKAGWAEGPRGIYLPMGLRNNWATAWPEVRATVNTHVWFYDNAPELERGVWQSADLWVIPMTSGLIWGLFSAPRLWDPGSMKQVCFKSATVGYQVFLGCRGHLTALWKLPVISGMDDFLHQPLVGFSHGIPSNRKIKPQREKQLRAQAYNIWVTLSLTALSKLAGNPGHGRDWNSWLVTSFHSAAREILVKLRLNI